MTGLGLVLNTKGYVHVNIGNNMSGLGLVLKTKG